VSIASLHTPLYAPCFLFARNLVSNNNNRAGHQLSRERQPSRQQGNNETAKYQELETTHIRVAIETAGSSSHQAITTDAAGLETHFWHHRGQEGNYLSVPESVCGIAKDKCGLTLGHFSVVTTFVLWSSLLEGLGAL